MDPLLQEITLRFSCLRGGASGPSGGSKPWAAGLLGAVGPGGSANAKKGSAQAMLPEFSLRHSVEMGPFIYVRAQPQELGTRRQ